MFKRTEIISSLRHVRGFALYGWTNVTQCHFIVRQRHLPFEGFFLKNYQDHIPCSFAYKVVCVDDDKFSKFVVVFKDKNACYEFIKAILKEYQYC